MAPSSSPSSSSSPVGQYEQLSSPLILKVIAVVAVLLFIALNLLTYQQMTERVTSALRSDIENRSFIAARAIEEYFAGQKQIVRLMADLATVKTYLQTARQETIETTPGYQEIQELLKSASGTDKNSEIAWIASELDDYSFSYDFVTTTKEEWDTQGRPWYAPTMQTAGIYVTDPYVDIEMNEICFSIIQQVKENSAGENNRLLGFAGIDLFLPPVVSIMEGFIEPRISSYPILVSDNGTILYRPEFAPFARNIKVFSSSLENISPSLQQVFDKSKRQNEVDAVIVPIREETHYVGISPIKGTNLSVLIICPRTAYESSVANFLHTLLSATIFNVLLLLLPVVLFLWIAMRRRNQFLNIKQLYNVVVNRMKVGVAVISPETGYCDLMNEAYLSFLEMKPTRKLFFPDIVHAKFQVSDSYGSLFTIAGKRRSSRGQTGIFAANAATQPSAVSPEAQSPMTGGLDTSVESTIYPGVATSQFSAADTLQVNGLSSAVLAQTALPESTSSEVSLPNSSTWQMMQLTEYSEVSVKTSWGERVFMHHLTSFQDHSGRPRLLSVLTDITELKAAQNSLREARDAARALSLAKSVFTANMAQEIRTQINGLIGMSERLSRTQLEDSQMQYLEMMRIGSASLLTVINNISLYSKTETGQMTIDAYEFDLHNLIDACSFVPELEAKRKGLEFERFISPEVPRLVKSDGVRLQYVLSALLENACKFTAHGKISLRVTMQHSQAATAKGKTMQCCFAVEDTGTGISEEKQRQLFHPFMQADAAATRKFGGTGLELAIVKRIVDLLKGKISCRSELKKGAVFSFQIPLALAGKSHASEVARAANLRPLRLLLVDDVNVNLVVLKAIVEQQGHAIELCGSGAEALEALARNDYDLMMIDCNMPEMNGYECAQIIRDPQSSVRNHHIPILAVTPSDDTARCFDAGMDDYLTKPISPHIVLKKLVIWSEKIVRKSAEKN